MSSAKLNFINDAAPPTEYQLDLIAAHIIDSRRAHPEGQIELQMAERDRVQAVAFLRLALSVLDQP